MCDINDDSDIVLNDLFLYTAEPSKASSELQKPLWQLLIIHGLLLQFMNHSGSFVSLHFAHYLIASVYRPQCKNMSREMKKSLD